MSRVQNKRFNKFVTVIKGGMTRNNLLFNSQKTMRLFLQVIIHMKGKVTEYGKCENTDTLGISENINPTKNI